MHCRYINHPIVAVDANFRLRNVRKSTEENDPGLHMGLAYFVDHYKYIQHIRKYVSQKDVGSVPLRCGACRVEC